MPRGLYSIETLARIALISRSISRAIRASITGISAAKAATRSPLGVGPALVPPAPPAKPGASSEISVWPLLIVTAQRARPSNTASAQFSRISG
jgi:hypothetical protein